MRAAAVRRQVALLGQPNVGKSTLFNRLTHSRQHTGNWAGKTVEAAEGSFRRGGVEYLLVDLPGFYSLDALTPDQQVSRDALLSGRFDAVIIVVDACQLENQLALALAVAEICPAALLAVNLLDEAKKKHVSVDLALLEQELGMRVVGISARSGAGVEQLLDAVEQASQASPPSPGLGGAADSFGSVDSIDEQHIRQLSERSLELAQRVCSWDEQERRGRDQRIDRVLTSWAGGIPAMLLLLALVFWITISGANGPSGALSSLFGRCEAFLSSAWLAAGWPLWLHGLLIEGVFRTAAWVVAVMLPPMAIFFPLFTLIEDSGYLPRIAFNLDPCFRRAGAHGKQALTMCMGFGCNACGVTGCRIIDSPRERLIAMLTNVFVPCNGRYPAMILLISLFFAANGQVLAALLLTLVILLGILCSLLVSKLLSSTLLRGVPSAFALELPSYRRPQIGRVIVDSLRDRTAFVLARALCVAAPAGALIWLLAHFGWLAPLTQLLEPLGHFIGLDGVLLLAFILAIPANEIVLPVAMMCYTLSASLSPLGDLAALRELLLGNGWTALTAICFLLFSLLHFPCATTLLTIRKESGSWKWTLVAFALPTAIAFIVCAVVAQVGYLLQ